jgi:hypothetical protein
MNSTHTVYDVNSAAHNLPHVALDKFAGLSLYPLPADITTVPPPTLVSSIATFFHPRTTVPPAPTPVRANESYGDLMPIPITPATTRLYFINLNGINLDKKAVKFRDLCEEIKHSNIHILAAAEHNLDTNKFAVRKTLQDIARQTFTHHSLQTATSSVRANKFYKPGGTLLLAQGDMISHIKEKGSNTLGRWTWMKLVGKNQKLITVISAYQVCIRPTHRTGTTAYHQQQSLLRQKGAKKANPRKYFHRDLNEFIRIAKTRDENIILTLMSQCTNDPAWRG